VSPKTIIESHHPLLRYDLTWIYHFLEDEHNILHCWKNGTWISSTKQLKGNGMIHNSSVCLLTADAFQSFPWMSGIFQTTIDAARPYVPNQVAIIASHELQTLKESIPSEAAQLDYVKS
jgi:hypothetical protein